MPRKNPEVFGSRNKEQITEKRKAVEIHKTKGYFVPSIFK